VSSGARARPEADPAGVAVQRAEDAALPGGGRRFATLAELRVFVAEVVDDPWWQSSFPWAPVDVEVRARSGSATWSAAHVAASGEAVVFLRRGSWDAVTVVHELAHVAARSGLGDREAHDEAFTEALCLLWRRHLGVYAWASLVEALADGAAGDQERPERSPARQRDRRRSGTSR
jgi:putative metallohydrolase (TIGR04338 family)